MSHSAFQPRSFDLWTLKSCRRRQHGPRAASGSPLYFCSLIEYLQAMKLGENIKKVRQAAGLNQKEVAERAGVDPGMLSKIENRGQNPSLEILRRIASGIGCSVADLLPDDMRRPQRASPTKATKSPDTRPAKGYSQNQGR
jgi:transcriptional regulator with XRE-family HTH domain